MTKTDQPRGHTTNDLNQGNTKPCAKNDYFPAPTKTELDEIKRAIEQVKANRQESIECAKPFINAVAKGTTGYDAANSDQGR